MPPGMREAWKDASEEGCGEYGPETRADASRTHGAGRARRAGQTRSLYACKGRVRRDLITGEMIIAGTRERPTTWTSGSGCTPASGHLSRRFPISLQDSGGLQGTPGEWERATSCS